jgi:hypothetical protein
LEDCSSPVSLSLSTKQASVAVVGVKYSKSAFKNALEIILSEFYCTLWDTTLSTIAKNLDQAVSCRGQ